MLRTFVVHIAQSMKSFFDETTKTYLIFYSLLQSLFHIKMNVNPGKTKDMGVGRRNQLKGHTSEHVQYFKYLDRWWQYRWRDVAKTGSSRITVPLNPERFSETEERYLKLSVYRSTFMPILVYCSKLSTISKHRRQIQTLEMWCLREVEGKSWRDLIWLVNKIKPRGTDSRHQREQTKITWATPSDEHGTYSRTKIRNNRGRKYHLGGRCAGSILF